MSFMYLILVFCCDVFSFSTLPSLTSEKGVFSIEQKGGVGKLNSVGWSREEGIQLCMRVVGLRVYKRGVVLF